MKKTAKTKDELRTEYDFASMKGDVPGKYAEKYQRGTRKSRRQKTAESKARGSRNEELIYDEV